MKRCPQGHYYEGDTCPYCPTQFYSVRNVNPFDGHGNLKQHIAELMTIPTCPHCGRPLRKGIPHPDYGIVVSSLYDIRDRIVPWNYKWDGRCENCGHDYNIEMHIDISKSRICQVPSCASARRCPFSSRDAPRLQPSWRSFV